MCNASPAISSTDIPIPHNEDIKSQLNGSQYFTKLDFTSAFHQIQIDEPSRYLSFSYRPQVNSISKVNNESQISIR